VSATDVLPDAARDEAHVPEWLPPTAPPPEPARRINFFAALLLYPLMPRRYGPHLAVMSFSRALAAYLIASVLTLGLVGATAVIALKPDDLSLHAMRVRAAEAIVDAAVDSASGGTDWIEMVAPLAGVPVLAILLVPLAILIMPWAAGGDRAGSVFKRSLKNTYWASLLLVPQAVLACAIMWLDHAHGFPPQGDRGLYFVLGVLLVAIILAGLWLRALIVGAARYVGDPAGPAFHPRAPLCEPCGYRISGLPVSGRCPECGEPVAASLPGARRRPTPFHEHEFRPRGLRELVRMQFRAFRRDYFVTLPVQGVMLTSRHFWWGTLLLMSLVLVGLVRALGVLLPRDIALSFMFVLCALVLVAPLALQSILLFLACCWGQLRHGIRDYRVSAAVCYYGGPLMWPMLIVPGVLLVIHAAVLDPQFINIYFGDPVPGMSVALTTWLIIAGPGFALAGIILWWLGLCRGLSQCRFANA